MKRPLRPDEARLWARVASTVRLAPGRTAPEVETAPPPLEPVALTKLDGRPSSSSPGRLPASKPKPYAPPQAIEPQRKRRIGRGREDIAARLDLHGLDQDRARAVLHAFLLRAYHDGARAVLVITGKGRMGEGVLRRRAPDWLADPAIRPIIAGLSPAERHHGGEGAFYIALKRKPR